MVDGLMLWWQERQQDIPEVKRLVINIDNGPKCNGRRSQFLQRMVQFADITGLDIHLVYYPLYHSKYNAIERYWAGLERSWHGYLLDTVNCVLQRAGNFVWKGLCTTVKMIDAVYEKGVKVCRKEKLKLEHRLNRSHRLPLFDITINHEMVY